MARKKYVACTNCRRIINRKNLLKEGEIYRCPYCGGTKFAEVFNNIVLILDPEKSFIAKQIEKEDKGMFALTIEL